MEAHKRIRLIDHAMHLWRSNSEEYRTKIDTYLALLEKKRELKIRPLGKIKKSILSEYPHNEFLSQTSEKEARQLLENLSDREIQRVLDEIYDIWNTNCAFVTLNARIIDFGYQIRHHNQKKTAFSYDPNTIKQTTRRKSHHLERE